MLVELVGRLGAEAGPGAMTALALASVMEGDVSSALEWADRAHESSRSTYLDLALGYVVAGLANAIRGDASEVIAAFSAARQEVDSTGDVVAQAIVRLAESHAMAAVGATSARSVQREAERRLADLGIQAEGWSTIFSSVQRWRAISRTPVR
jgi:Arc/MetJ family transcription regulator